MRHVTDGIGISSTKVLNALSETIFRGENVTLARYLPICEGN